MFRLHLSRRGIILKISSITASQSNHQIKYDTDKAQKRNPNFKGVGMSLLGASGIAMQWIENKGYFISFLIQDGLGMTLPRALTGFQRDKDITGKINTQEGFEVLGREALTGPFIISVAPIMLALCGKFCKSTNTNTRLIKRLGENLKTFVKNPELDKAVLQDKNRFKEEFYRYSIEKMYKNTVKDDKNSEETINYILSQFKDFEGKKKAVRDEALARMTGRINEKLVEHSSDLYNVNKLYVGEGATKDAFNSGEALLALRDYATDAIIRNPNQALIDEAAGENIKNNYAAKRLFVNIGNVVVTLVGLSLLPKLYMRSNVSPAARALEAAQKQQNNNDQNSNATTFKGKGVNSDGFFAKLGKFITKHTPEKIHSLLEYTGYNFSKTTFAALSTFGLLLPRGLKAWKRAPIDENGKRDKSEINEILLRDTVSSLSVVFAVPCLTKMLVRTYEDKMGFILTNRASDGKNLFKKAIDILWPYSNLEVLSVSDLNAIYGNIDSKSKLMNFGKFIDSKGGDLEKILSKSENASKVFNEKLFTLDSIRNLSKEEKNKKILSAFEKFDDKKLISELMKGSGDIKNNKIAKVARGLNSLPGFISTVVISPLILGVFIPMLTYHNTRKANAKKLQEKVA